MTFIHGDITRTQYGDEWRLKQALKSLREENERLRRKVHSSKAGRFSSLKEFENESNEAFSVTMLGTINPAQKTRDAILRENIELLQKENDNLKEMVKTGKAKLDHLVSEYKILDRAMQKVHKDYDELLEQRAATMIPCDDLIEGDSVSTGSCAKDLRKMEQHTTYSLSDLEYTILDKALRNAQEEYDQLSDENIKSCDERTILNYTFNRRRNLKESEPDNLELMKHVQAHLRMIKKLVECPVCLEFMEDTHVSPDCLHRFCGNCIKSSIRKCKHECPTCRIHIPTKRSVRVDREFDALVREVEKLFDVIEEVKGLDGKYNFALKQDHDQEGQSLTTPSLELKVNESENSSMDKPEAISNSGSGTCFPDQIDGGEEPKMIRSPTGHIENKTNNDKDATDQAQSREEPMKQEIIDGQRPVEYMSSAGCAPQNDVEQSPKSSTTRNVVPLPAKKSPSHDHEDCAAKDASRSATNECVKLSIPRKRRIVEGNQESRKNIKEEIESSNESSFLSQRVQIPHSTVTKRKAVLAPSVQIMLRQMISSGFCTEEELDGDLMTRLKLLSEQDAIAAMKIISSTPRENIGDFYSYVVDRLNDYLLSLQKGDDETTENQGECMLKVASMRGNSPVLTKYSVLKPSVQASLQHMITSGFCTEEELDGDLITRLRLMTEPDAIAAIKQLSSTPREQIGDFHAYAVGSLNAYVSRVLDSEQHQQEQNKMFKLLHRKRRWDCINSEEANAGSPTSTVRLSRIVK